MLLQNIEQLLWDMNQILRNDPSRRFSVGYSIENTSMRIWRCDRSDIVSSEEFDFKKVRYVTVLRKIANEHQQDYMRVIQFFLSVLYADDEQLGCDPTMVPLEDDEDDDEDDVDEDDEEPGRDPTTTRVGRGKRYTITFSCRRYA